MYYVITRYVNRKSLRKSVDETNNYIALFYERQIFFFYFFNKCIIMV